MSLVARHDSCKMATRHILTKLLPLTSQTKLSLTLTLTLLNPNICVQIVELTPTIRFSEFIKEIFAKGALAGCVGGANYCTTSQNST